jgi:hypothetical protein
MKYRVGLVLCFTAFGSQALADAASEAFVRERIDALGDSPDWDPAVGAVSSEDPYTVITGLRVALPSQATTLSAGEIRVENLVPEDDERFSFTGGAVSDLRVVSPALAALVPNTDPDNPEETLTIGALETRGISFLDPNGFTALSQVNADTDRAIRQAAMLEAFRALPKVGHFAMRDVTLGRNEPLTMATLTVDVADYFGPFPLPWSAEMTDLALPGLYVRRAVARVDQRVAQILTMLDEREFSVDVTGGESWVDQANGEVRATARAVIDESAIIDVAYEYAGMSETWLASVADEAILGDFRTSLEGFEQGALLKSMTIRISDRTLMDEIFGSVAEQLRLGTDGASYRRQISMLALPLFLLALGHPEYLDTFLEPLQAFVGEGKTLILEMRPEEPVPAAVIADALSTNPGSLVTLLNLTMRSEDAPL